MTISQLDAVTWMDDELLAEKKSRGYTFTCSDSVDGAVTPNAGTVTWSLTDSAGTAINSRSDVAITAAASMTVVIGDVGNEADTAIQSGETAPEAQRRLTVEWEYDSTWGTDLKGGGVMVFWIKNLVAVT